MNVKTVLDEIITSNTKPSIIWNNFCKNNNFTFHYLQSSKLIIQRTGETTFEHTMNVMDSLHIKNYITLLSAMFHDIGKTKTKTIQNDKICFWGHEFVSSSIAKQTLPRWGINKDIIDSVSKIIETHMLDIKSNMTEGKIKQFIASVGINNIQNWFALRRADVLSYQNKKTTLSSTQYFDTIILPFEKKVYEQINEINDYSISEIDHEIVGNGIQISGE